MSFVRGSPPKRSTEAGPHQDNGLPRGCTTGSRNEPHPVWAEASLLDSERQKSRLLLTSHHQGSHSPPVDSPLRV